MEASKEGIALIKKFEGCKLEAYKCPAGVWTCGYGSTKGVEEGDIWSQEKADHMLEVELKEFGDYVNNLVDVPLSQNQFDALVAWTFNLGKHRLSKFKFMLHAVEIEDWEEMAKQMENSRWFNQVGRRGRELKDMVLGVL